MIGDADCVKKGNSVSVETLSGERWMLHEYRGKWPKLGTRVYIAEGAQIVGDVEIGDHSSVWYNCVIRGDVDRKSTRLNSSHGYISYAVFCLKKKNIQDPNLSIDHV